MYMHVYVCKYMCKYIKNLSEQLLFSHMEYVGDDFAADSQAIADHPETRVSISYTSCMYLHRNILIKEMVEDNGRISSSNFMGRSTTI